MVAKKDFDWARVLDAIGPLVAIADAYDSNNLDDEARKHWGPTGVENTNTRSPDQIELYSGRGGKELLTLEHCFKAREVVQTAIAMTTPKEIIIAELESMSSAEQQELVDSLLLWMIENGFDTQGRMP